MDLEEQRKVTTIEARKFAQQNGNMLFYEASAKNNINVEQAFRELDSKAVKRQMAINPATGQPTGRIQDTKRMQLEAKKKNAKESQGCKCWHREYINANIYKVNLLNQIISIN